MRKPVQTKRLGGRKIRIKIRYFLMTLPLLFSISAPSLAIATKDCPDLKVVFARGSGGERWEDKNYLAFKSAVGNKLKTTKLKYEFVDLDYPAVGIGIDKLGVTLGAFFGAGDAYEFGESVNTGVKNLTKTVNNTSCPQTKYVLGGYSQGAMVVSKSLANLKADKVIYAATFGDPKIYLPEGKGLIPPACSGKNLSRYRMYVPDCQAYKGMLGAYIPYEPSGLAGKVGTWCNKRDAFCSSHLNVNDHLGYISDNLYEDASKVIFDKVAKTYNIKNTISSPHDTAILIDSSGSMASMIEQYKDEALRLAKETLDAGGRVALYDYRDLDDPYTPVEHCDFSTCTLEKFQNSLVRIQTDGGGDDPESLLSAAFHAMSSLKWKYGATKSLVVLTDANFLAPDRDGMTFDEVVSLSKKIDPVNFYIITNEKQGDDYQLLASKTDGKVVTNFDELSLLTDYILERYDSLPRVEENDTPAKLPHLEIKNYLAANNNINIAFETTAAKTLVVLNDRVLGTTSEKNITIEGVDLSIESRVGLVPIDQDVHGEIVELKIAASKVKKALPLIPKAPNTGQAKMN